MNRSHQLMAFILSFAVIFSACGGEDNNSNKGSEASNESGLSAFEQEHGIGPVTEVVVLNEIDLEMAEKGGEIFEMKCSACHKLNERYIGPALDDVLDKRSPTYVMNMILNPDGMVKEHPEAKKLLQEYMSPMPNQGLTREEARSIVEYIASDLED